MRIVFIFGLLVGLTVITSSCGEDDAETPTVAATTGVVADLAGRLGGRRIEVEQVIPDTASPHDFQLSAEARQTLEEASLIVSVGAGLEAGLPLSEVDAPQWALTESAGELLPVQEAGVHVDEPVGAQAGGEDEPGGDPHVWMDPTRVAQALPSLADALAKADPAGAAGYRARAEAYAAELRELDRELRLALARIPVQDRELVTSHDSLAYFANRYRLEVVATAFPASGPEAEASAAQLQEVVEAIDSRDVPAVFAQQEDDPRALRLIAEQAGVEIEEGLIIESPAAAGSYPQMLRHDGELIVAALGS